MGNNGDIRHSPVSVYCVLRIAYSSAQLLAREVIKMKVPFLQPAVLGATIFVSQLLTPAPLLAAQFQTVSL